MQKLNRSYNSNYNLVMKWTKFSQTARQFIVKLLPSFKVCILLLIDVPTVKINFTGKTTSYC